MRRNILRNLKKASRPVKEKDLREAENKDKKEKPRNRGKPIPPIVRSRKVGRVTQSTKGSGLYAQKAREVPLEEIEDLDEFKKRGKDFVEIEVESSTGVRYKVVVPKSYQDIVPRYWKWDDSKYRIAELIAMGVPFTQIPDDPKVNITNRMTIYAYLQHPEFKEHVDGLTMETGFANQRERIAGMNRITRILFDKVVREIDNVPLNDRSIGAILQAIQTTAKYLAQEKQEFIEESKVTQDTNIKGHMAVVSTEIEDLLETATAKEREALEEEFKKVGDAVIRGLTGDDAIEDDAIEDDAIEDDAIEDE